MKALLLVKVHSTQLAVAAVRIKAMVLLVALESAEMRTGGDGVDGTGSGGGGAGEYGTGGKGGDGVVIVSYPVASRGIVLMIY